MQRHKETSPAAIADQHVEIFRAIVDGELPRARCTMRAHLRAAFEDVEKIRQRSPELFASDDGSVPVRKNVVARAHPARPCTPDAARAHRTPYAPAAPDVHERSRPPRAPAVALRDGRRVEWVIMWTPVRARSGVLVSRRVIDECRRTATGCPGRA